MNHDTLFMYFMVNYSGAARELPGSGPLLVQGALAPQL